MASDVHDQQARQASGRNPRTGETIGIKAAKVPQFRSGKGLKDAPRPSDSATASAAIALALHPIIDLAGCFAQLRERGPCNAKVGCASP